jgi:hypothetical protein
MHVKCGSNLVQMEFGMGSTHIVGAICGIPQMTFHLTTVITTDRGSGK